MFSGPPLPSFPTYFRFHALCADISLGLGVEDMFELLAALLQGNPLPPGVSSFEDPPVMEAVVDLALHTWRQVSLRHILTVRWELSTAVDKARSR